MPRQIWTFNDVHTAVDMKKFSGLLLFYGFYI